MGRLGVFRVFVMIAMAILALTTTARAQTFTGTFTGKTDDGENVLVLRQSGDMVTGSYTVGPTKLVFTGKVDGGKAKGTATLEGTPVKFFVVLSREGSKLLAEITEQGDDGKPDPKTTEKVVLAVKGGSTPEASNPLETPKPASPSGNPLAGTADKLVGTFKAKDVTVVVKGTAGTYSGTITKGSQSFPFTAAKDGLGLAGAFESGGEKYQFLAKIEGEALELKTGDTVYVLLREAGASPVTGGKPGNPLTMFTKEALTSVAEKVKSNLRCDRGDKVLSPGEPPLTVASVAAFAGLMKVTFGADLTETEFEQTGRHFVIYYEKADGQTKAMLAGGWQKILDGVNQGTAQEQAGKAAEVRQVFQSRFEAGAKAGMPWAIAMHDAIQRRATTVAAIKGEKPDYAKNAGLHAEMTEADLDASLEMLYFMWVASGRNASLVTPEAAATVRALIVRNFPNFPPQVQYIFANAQKVYSSVRGEWSQSTQAHRIQMAQSFASSLDQLGLTVPTARGDRISAGGAWSDMNGKSHSAWAGEMVMGLAGNSYHNAWTSR